MPLGIRLNLPGGTWAKTAGYSSYDPQIAPDYWANGQPSDTLIMGTGGTNAGNTDVGLAAPMTGYVPTSVSGDAKFLWGGGGNLALGFYGSTLPSANTGGAGALTGFTGISVSRGGVLTLYEDGTAAGSHDSDISASWGTKTLSYDVDTETGAVSNVVYGGTAISELPSTTALTASATAYAAAVATGDDAQTLIDNITVVGVVPEPATLALLGLGGLGLLVRRRRS